MDIGESYKKLELDAGASPAEVKKAYKGLVKVWHPDRFTENPRLRAKATEKLKEINIAYIEIKKAMKNAPIPSAGARNDSLYRTTSCNIKKTGFRTGSFWGFLLSLFRFHFFGPFLKYIRGALTISDMKSARNSWHTIGRRGLKSSRNPRTPYAKPSKGKRFSEIMDEVAKAKKTKAG